MTVDSGQQPGTDVAATFRSPPNPGGLKASATGEGLETAELRPNKRIRRFWMRTVQLSPNERLVLQSGAIHHHQWHVSYGNLYLTDQRLLFHGYFFRFSLALLGHRHQWRLMDLEAAGESRHAATFLLDKHLYIQAQGKIHFFRVGSYQEWLTRLAEAGIRMES